MLKVERDTKHLENLLFQKGLTLHLPQVMPSLEAGERVEMSLASSYLQAVNNLVGLAEAPLTCFCQEDDKTALFAGLRKLQFDSDFFGFQAGRLDPLILVDKVGTQEGFETSSNLLSQIVERARAEGFEQLSCYASPRDSAVLYALSRQGFTLADTTCRYELDLNGWLDSSLSKFTHDDRVRGVIRPLVESDIKSLATLTAQNFLDAEQSVNRFTSDPRFVKSGRLQEFYRTWFRNIANGRLADRVMVFAAEEDNEPLAFLSVSRPSQQSSTLASGLCGSIPMMAVSRRLQGKGIYRALLIEALNWLVAQGVSYGELWTHVSNTANHVVWQRLGGRLTCTVHCFHKDL